MQWLKSLQQQMMGEIQAETCSSIGTQQTGFALYRGSYLAGLSTALKAIYPVVHALVGEVFFRGLSREYVYQTPLRAWDLNDYGQTFSNFIAEHPACHQLPYLAEVAQLEWACHWVLNAPPTPEFDLFMLQRCSAESYETLKFHLLPRLTILKFKYPITRIWLSHQKPLAMDEMIDISGEGEQLVVWAKAGGVSFTAISDEEKFLLSCFQQGKTLGESILSCEAEHVAFEVGWTKILEHRWLSGTSQI